MFEEIKMQNNNNNNGNGFFWALCGFVFSAIIAGTHASVEGIVNDFIKNFDYGQAYDQFKHFIYFMQENINKGISPTELPGDKPYYNDPIRMVLWGAIAFAVLYSVYSCCCSVDEGSEKERIYWEEKCKQQMEAAAERELNDQKLYEVIEKYNTRNDSKIKPAEKHKNGENNNQNNRTKPNCGIYMEEGASITGARVEINCNVYKDKNPDKGNSEQNNHTDSSSDSSDNGYRRKRW